MIKYNTIYNMDCLEGMRAIKDSSVDMVLCDLPYGTTANKWDCIISLSALWKTYKRVCKSNAAIVLTASQPFTSLLGSSNISRLKYAWVWEKEPSGNLNAKIQPMRAHEDVLVFSYGRPLYQPQGLKSTLRKRTSLSVSRTTNYGGQKAVDYIQTATGYPQSILSFAKDKPSLHPTQKPVALFEYLIHTYTNDRDVVLDNCIGSGTTAIACIHTKRNFIGFELDDNYYRIACERIANENKATRS